MGTDLDRAAEFEYGIIVSDTVLIDSIVEKVNSTKPTFTGDDLTKVEYYNSHTQIDANRIMKVDIAYSGDDVTSETYTIYKTDGTTTFKTVVINYTYSGGEITKAEVTES